MTGIRPHLYLLRSGRRFLCRYLVWFELYPCCFYYQPMAAVRVLSFLLPFFLQEQNLLQPVEPYSFFGVAVEEADIQGLQILWEWAPLSRVPGQNHRCSMHPGERT